MAATKALAAEALADRYLDIRALLKLLTRLTQADWANHAPGGANGGAHGGQAEAADVAQVWWGPLKGHPCQHLPAWTRSSGCCPRRWPPPPVAP